MSESTLRTDGSLEAQPRMGVRNLHNFIYCPRLFYFQWVENIFQENADTVAGSRLHQQAPKLEPPRPGGDDSEVLVVQTPGAQIGQRGDQLIVSLKGEDVRKIP